MTPEFPTTIAGLRDGFREKKFSPSEVARSYFRAIEAGDGEIHAYLDVYRDLDASIIDDDLVDSKPLFGVPIAVKDNILIRGRRTTAGSKILENYSASYDATVIEKLKKAGAVFLGKTNMDEFAMGSSTENSAYGPTKNPHDQSRVPGGSSGGSAAAVSAGLAHAALGSDTGGSIRQPASLCGVVGFKPSYGEVSRSGLIAMASSLDQIGPITRSVSDAREMFNVIRGRDPLDSTTVETRNQETRNPGRPLRANSGLGKKQQWKIGVPKEYFRKGLDPDVARIIQNTIKKCETFGCEIKEISLPHAEYALAAYYIIMPAEVSANLARFDGIRYGHSASNAKNLLEVYEKSRAEGFGAEAKRRVILGTFTLSHGYYDAYYLKAQKVRRLIREDFEHAFGDVDFIVGPTSPTPAFKLGEKTEDPLAMYLADIYTVAVNLAGVPAISIPVGTTKVGDHDLPVGFQIIANRFQDDALLNFAETLEGAIGFQYS